MNEQVNQSWQPENIFNLARVKFLDHRSWPQRSYPNISIYLHTLALSRQLIKPTTRQREREINIQTERERARTWMKIEARKLPLLRPHLSSRATQFCGLKRYRCRIDLWLRPERSEVNPQLWRLCLLLSNVWHSFGLLSPPPAPCPLLPRPLNESVESQMHDKSYDGTNMPTAVYEAGPIIIPAGESKSVREGEREGEGESCGLRTNKTLKQHRRFPQRPPI